METSACPHCNAPLGNGISVCGECGKEVGVNEQLPGPEEKSSNKKIYGILAVFLVVVGGAALLLFTGLVPNPFRDVSTAAIVNGEKISSQEVEEKLEIYKKISGQAGRTDLSSPQGKAILNEVKRQILHALIQEKILVTEALKEKIAVLPQEVKDRMDAIKKGMNLSDKDFEQFLKNHAMSLSNFEKRVEKEILITKFMAKNAQEKGLSGEALLNELNAKAKVEIFAK
jgi:hypothetical protein